MNLQLSGPAIAFAFLFLGCHLPTPLPPQQVEQLTTCRTGDLSAIKKNLVLAGWSIAKEDGDLLETDFKQTDSYRTASIAERIAVVRLDDARARFVVRLRYDGHDRVTTGEVQDERGKTVATSSQVVDTRSDSDETYDDSGLDVYAARRQKVCGAY